MPKISIIIPVYNSDKYLSPCIESILSQEYDDFEIIIINDGSTDNSLSICEKYKQKDDRIKLFTIENGGASAARNYGLSKAQGKWIAFVDSDDYILPSYLSNMSNAIQDKTDIVISNYGGRQKDVIITEDIVVEGQQLVKYFIEKNIFALSAPYGKLYRQDILTDNQIKFPVGIHMGEDMVFFGQYMNHTHSASLICDDSYFVNANEGSLSTRYYSFESEFKCFNLWEKEISQFIKKGNIPIKEQSHLVWQTRTAATLFRCFESMYKGPVRLSVNDCIKLMHQLPRFYYDQLGKSCTLTPISGKIKIWLLSKHCYRGYILLGRILHLMGK